jgi:hypothetical protein
MLLPAPPDTIPGRPPNIAANHYKCSIQSTNGGKPANIANDNDSGIIVIATVKPAKTSVL